MLHVLVMWSGLQCYSSQLGWAGLEVKFEPLILISRAFNGA